MSDYFADDASLFSVIHGINVFAAELNEDLKKVSNGLLNGKWFLIQMLVNKLKKLYLVWKEKKPFILLRFSTTLLCLKLIHKNT